MKHIKRQLLSDLKGGELFEVITSANKKNNTDHLFKKGEIVRFKKYASHLDDYKFVCDNLEGTDYWYMKLKDVKPVIKSPLNEDGSLRAERDVRQAREAYETLQKRYEALSIEANSNKLMLDKISKATDKILRS